MKVLFLFTGGTIGSTVQGDFIGTDRKKPYLLLESYRRAFGIDFAYDTATPYTNLSENNTGDTLRVLMASVAEAAKGDYDGIIVTHGTDTMQYSAAALSYALADVKIPVMIVSSNQPIEHPLSNGLANLRAALRFIGEVGTPGVFVVYQNEGEAPKVHRGTRLCESLAFTDAVYSIYNSFYGTMEEGKPFLKNPAYGELENAMSAFGAQPLCEDCKQILRVAPHPGNPYRALTPDVKYILHTSYHSGTINTESERVRAYFASAKAAGVTTFLTGVAPGAAYDSTRFFEEMGIEPLYNIAPIAAYVKLWLLSAKYPDTPITHEMMQKSLGGDVVAE